MMIGDLQIAALADAQVGFIGEEARPTALGAIQQTVRGFLDVAKALPLGAQGPSQPGQLRIWHPAADLARRTVSLVANDHFFRYSRSVNLSNLTFQLALKPDRSINS